MNGRREVESVAASEARLGRWLAAEMGDEEGDKAETECLYISHCWLLLLLLLRSLSLSVFECVFLIFGLNL